MVIDDFLYFGNLKHSLLDGEDKTKRVDQIHCVLPRPVAEESMAASKAQTNQFVHSPNHSDLMDTQMDSSGRGIAVLAGGYPCVGAHQLQVGGGIQFS